MACVSATASAAVSLSREAVVLYFRRGRAGDKDSDAVGQTVTSKAFTSDRLKITVMKS